MTVEIIYCAGGNKRFAEIAIKYGFLYGSQLPCKINLPIYFADQNWKKPNKQKYIEALKKYKPQLATVLDFEYKNQLNEVLSWAEEIATIVNTVIIIPKFNGSIQMLPKTINNKLIRLGYSIPTKYGGTPLAFDDFKNYEVHLLGGSPHNQIKYTNYLNVKSVDCNFHMMMAERHNKFWQNSKWVELQTLGYVDYDAPYKAFELSCQNIINAWENRYKYNKTSSLLF